jgi:nicotinate-nucleotide adenylyltransferase
VHIGHLQLAENAITTFGLDELRCIPAGQPPHRQLPQASAADRLAMVELAFAHPIRCAVDDAEVLQTGPSWTIRTLERLRQSDPEGRFVLILGADALLGLPTWHRWETLLEYAHIAVANRPETALLPTEMPEPLRSFWAAHYTQDLALLRQQRAGCLVSFTIAPCKVSATQVRQNLKQGLPISGLVPLAVEKYIIQHHLYQSTAH